jgi:L-ascorbate metabolism protein UlaG (beta-lactamase superfamily)
MNKVFNNLSPTPQLAEGYTMFGIMKDFFRKPKTAQPPASLPAVKTDLHRYYSKTPSVIWFGHSSYLVHCDGINILVDPVLSGHASPIKNYIKAFASTHVYRADDMPAIDLLILTHNHYDHLDKGALRKLAPRIRSWVVPTGVAEDIKGLRPKELTELGWWEGATIRDGISITGTPARHFSGRGLRRNRSLWNSYVLNIKGYKLFLGGDSGYDTHFKAVGEHFGPFDIAMLECGQYNKAWPYIHSFPEELVTEGSELRAKMILPVHWGKFSLALHDWDEPIKRFTAAAKAAGTAYTTPMIGEPVVVDVSYPKGAWWMNNKED